MTWNVTVAAIIERAGRFLVVEEMDPGYPETVWNQPVGHVDPGEALLDAVVREVREETGLPFTPTSLVGVYQLLARSGRDYCRFGFHGTARYRSRGRRVAPIAAVTASDTAIRLHSTAWLRITATETTTAANA